MNVPAVSGASWVKIIGAMKKAKNNIPPATIPAIIDVSNIKLLTCYPHLATQALHQPFALTVLDGKILQPPHSLS